MSKQDLVPAHEVSHRIYHRCGRDVYLVARIYEWDTCDYTMSFGTEPIAAIKDILSEADYVEDGGVYGVGYSGLVDFSPTYRAKGASLLAGSWD